jgi:hypothetical protein
VTSELEQGLAVGDPVLVERLVCNLIDNAVRHNAAGGWLSVAAGSRDGRAFLTVANSGRVIGEPEVPVLFEPFRRRCSTGGPDAPEGSGLGLSIVQSVVRAHHGDIAAAPVPDGGLELTVLLPGCAPDGKNRHHIGHATRQCLPGGRPPVPPEAGLTAGY